MINLYVARHGQTDWNKEKRFQSRNDIPLNAVGLKQAEDLRSVLDNTSIKFDKVFSSPLSRAYKTATILSGSTDASIITDARLLEMNMGDYEGRKESDLETELGVPFTTWRDDIFIATAPNGEAFGEVCARCDEFLQSSVMVDSSSADESSVLSKPLNILIVAHQGVNIALQTVLSGNDKPPFTRALHKYKQHNDEINIWEMHACEQNVAKATLLKQIKL